MTALETNTYGLKRLARLLRRRFSHTTGRAFTLLAAAEVAHVRPANTDDMVTLPIPVMRGMP